MKVRIKRFLKKGIESRLFYSVLITLVSVGGLLLAYGGMENIDRLKILLKICLLGTVCVGAVFVFTVGAFGISLGASTLLSVVCGGVILFYSESFALSFIACLCISTLGCVLSALMSYTFSLPSYVTAAVMLTFFISVSRGILEIFGGEIAFGVEMWSNKRITLYALVAFILFFVVCALLYNASPIGRRQKRLGCNREVANLCGISTRLYSTMGYLVAGIGVGICGFFILSGSTSITSASVSDLGFNIIFAVVLGLVFLTGNGKNKLLYAPLGSISAVCVSEMLSYLLERSENGAPISQIIRSIILIAVLVISKNTKEEKTK